MKTTTMPSLTLLTTAAACLMVSCANVSTKPSGFLKNHTQLTPSKPGTPALAYRNAATAPRYHAVIIERVGFSAMAAAKLDPEERKRLGEDLTERTREVFTTRYQLADGSGPGILRLRTAVNDINTSNPMVNVVTTVAAFMPVDMGAVSVEMEAVDSVTGRRIAALLDQRQELPLGPKGFFSSFSPTGHVKSGFTHLAGEMLELLTSPAGETQPAESIKL